MIYFFLLVRIVSRKYLYCTTIGEINNAKSAEALETQKDNIELQMKATNWFQLPATVLDSSIFLAARCII